MIFRDGFNCLWFPPDDHAGVSTAPPPVILFLHGIGERGEGGNELEKAASWGLPKFRMEARPLVDGPFPFLVIAPQCPPDRRWCDEDMLASLDHLIAEIGASGRGDMARLHLTGFSMGGMGVFCLGLRAPATFASLAPVCGKCESPDDLPRLASLPIWLAYGEDDEVEHLTIGSIEAARRLEACGTDLEVLPYRLGYDGDLGPHVRTCDAAYAEPRLYDWMLRHGGS